jgi:hypothetical protein
MIDAIRLRLGNDRQNDKGEFAKGQRVFFNDNDNLHVLLGAHEVFHAGKLQGKGQYPFRNSSRTK